MLSFDANIETLSSFGLTVNQSRVYLAIARLRIGSVGQISKFSRVRREDVYRILPKLEKMGLVERVLGKPTRIRATPVEDALSILIKKEQNRADKRLAELKNMSEEFLKEFKTNNSDRFSRDDDEANFILLSQRDAIISKGVSMVKDARKEIDIMKSRTKLAQLIPAYAHELKKAIKKGVKVRIISDMPDFEDPIPNIIERTMSLEPSIILKYAEQTPSHYMIVDYQQALISTATDGYFAQNPNLWTNNNNLVSLMIRTFEDTWVASANIMSVETKAVSEKARHLVERLKPSNHVIFVYESKEAKHNILFNYLKVGLENGEATVYVAGDEEPAEISEAMKTFGIDVKKYEGKGALQIFRSQDVYLINGKFNLATTINLWNKLYSDAIAKGFKGLRVTGETACFFKHNLVEELVEYEKALHRSLDIPMIAICAYSADMLAKAGDPINLYSELIRAHGTVLFTGIDNKLGRITIREA